MEKIKILVTGGSGMVGRNVVEKLSLRNDYRLFYPVRKEVNLLDASAVSDYIQHIRPDYIIHCAGVVGGIQANAQHPVRFLTDNVDIGRNVIMGAAKAGVEKLINLGSSCMYPRDTEQPMREENILNGKLEFTNEGYALAKIYTTKLCEYLQREEGLDYKTLIPCNLYGKWDKFDPSNSHVMAAVIKKIHEAKVKEYDSVTIWGDGKARREFMYAEDLAGFIDFALDHFEDIPNIMNIGVGYDFSVREFYDMVSKAVGYEGQFNYDKSKPVGVYRKLLDVTRQNELGWKSAFSIEEGIRLTYEFYKQTL